MAKRTKIKKEDIILKGAANRVTKTAYVAVGTFKLTNEYLVWHAAATEFGTKEIIFNFDEIKDVRIFKPFLLHIEVADGKTHKFVIPLGAGKGRHKEDWQRILHEKAGITSAEANTNVDIDQSHMQSTKKDCLNCEAALEDGAQFCPNCDTQTTLQRSNQTDEDNDIQIVDNISSVDLICPNCGAELEEDSVFCVGCGVRIVEDAENAAPAPEPEKQPEPIETDIILDQVVPEQSEAQQTPSEEHAGEEQSAQTEQPATRREPAPQPEVKAEEKPRGDSFAQTELVQNASSVPRCSKCYAVLEEGDAFCPFCGTSAAIEKEEEMPEPARNQKPCISCGKNLDEEMEFCPYCGSPVNKKKCISCGKLFEEDMEFCPYCGTPQKDNKCKKCGRELADDMGFCPYCGEARNK